MWLMTFWSFQKSFALFNSSDKFDKITVPVTGIELVMTPGGNLGISEALGC